MKIMFNPIINNISFKAPLKNIYVLGYDSSLIKFNSLKEANKYLHDLYKTNPNTRMLYKIVDGEVIEIHKGDGSSYVDNDKVNMLAAKLSKLRKKKPNEVLSQKTQTVPSVPKRSEEVKLNQEITNETESPARTLDTPLGYETRLRIAKENFDWKLEGVHLDSSDDTFKIKKNKTEKGIKTPKTSAEKEDNAKEENKKPERKAKVPAVSAPKINIAKEDNTKTEKRANSPAASAEKAVIAKEDNKKTGKKAKSPQTSEKKITTEKKQNSPIRKSETPKSHNIQVPPYIPEKRTGHEIYAVNRYGKVILYSGITDAAKKLKITPADIVNCTIGKKSTASGFKFALASSIEEITDTGKVTLNQEKIDEIVKSFPVRTGQAKQKMPFYIYQIDKDGINKIFVSMAQAQKMTRIPYDKIEDCLDDTNKIINGSMFLTSAQVMKLDENGNFVEDEDKIQSLIEEKFGIEN